MTDTRRFPIPLWLLLLIGIVAISFSSIFIRWSDAPVSVIAMYRLLLTNLLMLPFLGRNWPEIRSISARDGLRLALSGLMLGLHFLFWMGSLRATTVASSTAIMALEPILVMLGSFWLYRHRTHPLAAAGMMIAIAGAALIGWGDFGLSVQALKGDLLSFLGTVAVALHMLIGKSLRSRINAFVYSFTVFASAAGVLAVYNASAGYSFTAYAPKEWGIFLMLAVVPTLFGHYLFNWLLQYMNATSVSMTVLGEPLGAGLLAYLLLNEAVTGLQAAAAGLLLFGVWLFIRAERKEPTPPLAEEPGRAA
ncbi:DMT family transporter [Paenibacillus aurantius]|uniref:DMT family transporter n=1 Tax=Paenibacillus aurantius TaxID=2918900 RepID=A0AA96LBG9_9BACL|nr:DMT family transporter [Paenibacillus aurantius]WNQ10069.1 DMT family transporter [Paenibacillus aurantius]